MAHVGLGCAVPPNAYLYSDSTRTLSSLLALALALSVSKLVLSLPAHIAAAATRSVPSSAELAEIRDLHGSLACAVGPLFFAALKDRPSGYLNTPLTVVASGMAKWLDIYSGVLMAWNWGLGLFFGVEMVESMKKSKRAMPIAANSSGCRSLGRVAAVVAGVALLLSLFLYASPDLLR